MSSAERFQIVETNPNDSGTGGCLCGVDKVPGCTGPFAVFNSTEQVDIGSPIPVIGANCLRKAAEALDGEVLAGGEPNEYLEGEAEEVEVEPYELNEDERKGLRNIAESVTPIFDQDEIPDL